MKFRHIYIVLKKELKDIFRDRKTWIFTLLLPILFLPVMMYFIAGGVQSFTSEKASDVKIAVRDEGNNEQFINFLKSTGITVEKIDDPKVALEKGNIRAVINIPANFEKDLNEGKNSSVTIQNDESNPKSSTAKTMLENYIKEYSNSIVKQRLMAKGIDPSILEPITLKFENVASENKMAGSFLSFIVPMLLALWTATGGMGAATDLAAGEKERGTLEPLLTTSPSRLSIMSGKYLAVTIMSILSAAASLIGLYVAFAMNPKFFGLSGGFKITGFIMGIMILTSILTAAIFAAIELALSTYARSFKEGQTYLTPVTFIAMIPAYMIMYTIPTEIPVYYFVIPIFGTISIFKELLYGIINITHMGMFVATSLIYIIAAIYLASTMFKKEWALFRT
ncbi:ABC transporter permease [Thermoanaerobacterium sp. RBIITD]|uniref:ABC transporter permease n=1 Tax=Thermoanaerobacterium sp. RBIITD TaxID=1550240 RepID=UPI000BB6ADFE|nr:ABC transporter permease [Thermoanaerobacterium sp. RBIITD]SNX53989.1 sodium transport system permease protein [Thermoanaerobacterium sp. RBIITD]